MNLELIMNINLGIAGEKISHILISVLYVRHRSLINFIKRKKIYLVHKKEVDELDKKAIMVIDKVAYSCIDVIDLDFYEGIYDRIKIFEAEVYVKNYR